MLEINVSPETEQVLKDLAAQNNQNVADFAGKLLENEVVANKSVNLKSQKEIKSQHENKENPLMKFVGLISSQGDGKTSENYKQILLEEADNVYGFGKE